MANIGKVLQAFKADASALGLSEEAYLAHIKTLAADGDAAAKAKLDDMAQEANDLGDAAAEASFVTYKTVSESIETGGGGGGGGGVTVVNTDPVAPAVGDAWILHTLPVGTGDLIAGDANIEFVIPQAQIGSPPTMGLESMPGTLKISTQEAGVAFNFITNDPMYGLMVEHPAGTTFQQFVDELNNYMTMNGFMGTFCSLLAPIGALPIPNMVISFTFVEDGVPESVVLKVQGDGGVFSVNLI